MLSSGVPACRGTWVGEGVAAQMQGNAGLQAEDDPGGSVLVASEYALFAQVGRPRRVEAGQRLFHRGDLGTSMFVTASGAVDLDFGGEAYWASELGRGALCGSTPLWPRMTAGEA